MVSIMQHDITMQQIPANVHNCCLINFWNKEMWFVILLHAYLPWVGLNLVHRVSLIRIKVDKIQSWLLIWGWKMLLQIDILYFKLF